MYVVSENYASVAILVKKAGEEWVIHATETALGGWAGIFDYRHILEPVGNVLARAEDLTPQLIVGETDIMALRKCRETYLGNRLTTVRSEL